MDGEASGELMTVEEVAEYLRVSPKTVYDWAQKGRIPAGKIGNTWRFRRKDVEEWVARRLGPARGGFFPSLAVRDVLSPERILIIESGTKRDVLLRLIEALASSPAVRDREELERAIFEREELMSTGIGLGVAVPHARLASIQEPVMAVAVCRTSIADYESLDGQPVQLVVMIAAGRDQHAAYIRLLAEISRRIKDAALRERILAARSPEEIYDLLTGAE